jgi:hypothetical protein
MEYYFFTVTPFTKDKTLIEAFCFQNGIRHTFAIVTSDGFLDWRNLAIFLSAISYPEKQDDYQYSSSEAYAKSTDISYSINSHPDQWIRDALSNSYHREEAEKANREITTIVIFTSSLLFMLPIIIYRFMINISYITFIKRRTALFTALIYTVISGTMLTFAFYCLAISIWFGLEAIILGLLIYGIFKKMELKTTAAD